MEKGQLTLRSFETSNQWAFSTITPTHRAMFEAVGCNWPAPEAEQDWLATINQITAVGDIDLATADEDQAQKVAAARQHFLKLLPDIKQQYLRPGSKDKDELPQPATLLQGLTTLHNLGANLQYIVQNRPQVLLAPTLQLVDRWKSAAALGLDPQAISQHSAFFWELEPDAVKARLQPLYAAVRALGWPTTTVAKLVNQYPRIMHNPPERTRLIHHIIFSNVEQADMASFTPDHYAAVCQTEIEKTIAAHLTAGTAMSSLYCLAHHTRRFTNWSKEELQGLLLGHPHSPAVQKYLQMYPVDDESAARAAYQHKLHSMEYEQHQADGYLPTVHDNVHSGYFAAIADTFLFSGVDGSHFNPRLRKIKRGLSVAEQNKLLEQIAQGMQAQEQLDPANQDYQAIVNLGKRACQTLVMALAPNVNYYASQQHRRLRHPRPEVLDELIQTGMLHTILAVRRYAVLPPEKQLGLAAYVQEALSNQAAHVFREETLGKTVNQQNRLNMLLVGFERFTMSFLSQHNRLPETQDYCTALDITPKDVWDLHALATRYANLENFQIDEKFDAYTLFDDDVLDQETDQDKANKVILVERALLFLNDDHCQMVQLRFGLGENPLYSIDEVAQALNNNYTYTSHRISLTLQKLHEIIPMVAANNFDAQQLRKDNVRNVISMLCFMGVEIPQSARLPELRQLARTELKQRVATPRDFEVMCLLYKLNDQATIYLHKDIAAAFGMSKQNVGVIEKRVLNNL